MINNSLSAVANSIAAYSNNQVQEGTKSSDASVSGTDGKKAVSGNTIGNPKLSEKASKYYEQLKKKYSNMNFILVSEDQKEQAKAQAGNYADVNSMVVLIDEDKIERMAEDESYRKQYEGIIANAASGLSQLKSSLSSSGASVKGFGMQINDNGMTSFFAVLDKSSAAQRKRIEKKNQDAKEAKKAQEKKDAKAEQKERLEKNHKDGTRVSDGDEDTVTITASSIEELLQKVQDYSQMSLSDNVQTESEKKRGQSIDYAI